MDVFVVHPDGAEGPFPVVIQLMDGLGMREELCEHARRTAARGYYVLAPDFFYRAGIKGPLDISDAAQRDKIMAAMGGLSDEGATGDAEAALKIAAQDPAARSGKIGLYGFCMGGRLALVLSQSLSDQVAAAASVHPGNLVTDGAGSPHRHVDQVRAELYFAIADRDDYATPEQMAEMEQELRAHHVHYELEWKLGALHGYMMPSRSEYNRAAAEETWDRIHTLFARTLLV
jgi:carboxymethylenebutenolidase